MTGSPPPQLPRLRPELTLEAAGRDVVGRQLFVLHDGYRNRYFRLPEASAGLLSAWPAGLTAEAAEAACDGVFAKRDFERLAAFLMANQLTVDAPGGNPEAYAATPKGLRASPFYRATNSLVFVSIPLFRPQGLLDSLRPLAQRLFTVPMALVHVLTAAAGLYLVSRQWDAFAASFISFLSLEGIVIGGAGLIFVKAIHEMGHALMATRYGVPVPQIGVSFILFLPILYTDTTAAWRLPRARQRVMIDAAGMIAELALAAQATLLWAFLEDGPMRAFVFSVATLSWLMSLAINLNPFMRFDGYYLLSDALGVENMQERGFALARWRLREMLFAFGDPPPERFAPLRHRLLIAYAWATWVYRVTLHTGIALAIWLLFPKVVAIWIAGLYLVVNLLLPIVKEVGEWRKNLKKSASPLRLGTLVATALAGVLLLFWPFQSRIVFPALASQASEERLYSPADALIVVVGAAPGKTVRAGDVLFEFRSPSLQQQRRLSKLRAAALSASLARIVADRTDRQQRVALERELAAEMERLAGFERLAEKLVVRAGIDGKVGFLDPDLTPGLWVRAGEPLAVLYREGGIDLDGLAQERSLPHLAFGQQAKFMPDNPFAPRFAARVTAIASSSAALIEPAELADRHGGDVPVAGPASGSSGSDGAMSPHGSWFRVRLAAADDVRLQGHTLRGRVEIWGSRESLAYALLRRFASVLIRESGF